jgi:hypothetical protein
MCKSVLVAAIVLLSTSAYAGSSRGLSLASTGESPTSTEPTKTEAVDTPRGPTATPAANDKSSDTARPRHKPVSTEARIIHELHRHGIYW